ncbi:MAG: ABC transporter permease [Gaiellaceae bacterium]
MIWLTWRQQRTETLIAALLLALVAALLVPTGLHLASIYESDGIAACLTDQSPDCRERISVFLERSNSLLTFVGWLNLVPALIGALLAAPFVLEFERGTFRLAWTQSITRGRWLATRLALIVGAAIATSVVLTLLMTWWRGPLDAVDGRMIDGFELEGLAPAAYTLFAAALVIAFGVTTRRTAAAIGLALVAFIAVRIGIANWARPHYQTPVHQTWVGDPGPELHGAWVFREGGEFRLAQGQQPPDPAVLDTCLSDMAPGKGVDAACLAQHDIGYYTFATFHPEGRFWLFQAIEASIFVALAVGLLAFSVWWIRKRIS